MMSPSGLDALECRRGVNMVSAAQIEIQNRPRVKPSRLSLLLFLLFRLTSCAKPVIELPPDASRV